MVDSQQILDLKEFREREKFSLEDWIRIGFVPSKFNIMQQLEDYFNACIDDVLVHSELQSVKRRILIKYLHQLNSLRINKQEKLLAYIYFKELAKITEVNIERQLDYWLFGLRGLLFYYFKPILYKRKKSLKDLQESTSAPFENSFAIARKKVILLEEIGL